MKDPRNLSPEEFERLKRYLSLKLYTSPEMYGTAIANKPLNKKGKRALHVFNFQRKGIPFRLVEPK